MLIKGLTLATLGLSVGLSTTATAEPIQSLPPEVTSANTIGQKPVLPLQSAKTYICGDGTQLTLDHDAAAGIMRGVYLGEVVTLQEQVGRTPPLFVNGLDTVAIDGGTAYLVRGRDVRLTCDEVPAQPTAGVVWGTVSKLDRMALPKGTKLRVQLLDTSRADAPAVEISSVDLTTSGNQVPLNFLLRFDESRILPEMRVSLSARITDARGKLLYITDTHQAVPAGAAPESPYELQLVRVGTQK